MRNPRRRAFWSTLFLAGLVPAGAALGQVVPPVQDLKCRCDRGVLDTFVASLAWVNPVRYDQIEIRRDARVLVTILGAFQQFADDTVSEGAHEYEVVGIVGRQRSPAAPCTVTCGAVGPEPVARIRGPARLILPPARSAEAIFDGRESRDAEGGKALVYRWLAPDPAAVQVLSPARSATRVRFLRPGKALLRLQVMGAPDFLRPGAAEVTVDVVDPRTVQLPEAPALFLPQDELFQDFLVAVAGGPAELALPLMFTSGLPFPDIALIDGPPGLGIDSIAGIVRWRPGFPQAGQAHEVEILARNNSGQQRVRLAIQAVDRGMPIVLYAFPLPRPGGGDGDGDGDGDDIGAGGGTGPPPDPFPDQSPIPLPLDLQIVDPVANDQGVVGVTQEPPADPFDGVRYVATCAATPGCVQGAYASLDAAEKLPENIDNDFSIEVWLKSRVLPAPAASPAFVFGMSEGAASNFAVGFRSDGRHEVSVRTTAGAIVSSVATGQPLDSDFHLVFVREGNTHRFYVDGTKVTEEQVPPGDLGNWDASLPIRLLSSSDESRPFFGEVYLAAVYGEALSDRTILVLSGLDPTIPDPDLVLAPRADICPDPREIRRGAVEADGSLSQPLAGAGGGFEGAAGGGGDAVCNELLRPFEWQWKVAVGPPGLAGLTGTCESDPGGGAVGCAPAPGEEECRRKIHFTHGADLAPGALEVELELTVRQVPIRRVSRTDTTCKKVRVPTCVLRADSNRDGAMDISDGITILQKLFIEREGVFPCPPAADANRDGKIDLSDAVYTFAALFLGGPKPPPPFPACGDIWADLPASFPAQLRYCEATHKALACE
ncbi:MAG: hypothetical protein HY721_29075 [Planctomycetes bacterium]|nr:hypothetical protein [Planctomycetota bacterium]